MSTKPKLIVGVGASAGGLDAFKAFLSGAEPGLGLAYVLVQHLDPSHDSMMADLLGRHAPVPVEEIADGVQLVADRTYVIPPGRYVRLDGGALRLRETDDPKGSRVAVDTLFRSLADELSRNSVGVVLSGTGSDGTVGLRAIRAAGGLTIAQDPRTAGHTGMPGSVIEQDLADLVLSPEQIVAAIARFGEHPYVEGGALEERLQRSAMAADAANEPEASAGDRAELSGPAGAALEAGGEGEVAGGAEMDGRNASTKRAARTSRGGPDDDVPNDRVDGAFVEILDLLRDELELDISAYKRSSLARRIERRMGLSQTRELGEYLRLLRDDPEEIRQLAREVHINVTDFFRDPEAFETLRRETLGRIFEEAAGDRTDGTPTVRVWVCGCATGEEAYSMAMLLHEERERRRHLGQINIQVFATDVDEGAIRLGRAATYPASSLSELEEKRLSAYFDRLDDGHRFRVRQFIRDMVSFARHDLLSDPPFSKVHLVTCCNVLIYLRKQAQERALKVLHFALRPGGVLMLGPSEGLGEVANSFRVLDKRWRIYRRLKAPPEPRQRPLPVFGGRERHKGVDGGGSRPKRSPKIDPASRLVASLTSPPSVLVNGRLEALHFHGDLIDFLDLPRETGKLTLIDMLREECRTRVRTAIYRASREREVVESTGSVTARDGASLAYRVTARPCADAALGDDLLLVSFESAERTRGAFDETASESGLAGELERELNATREDLRATVEELEHANEELRTSHEEATSMNEQLQSSNEELETQAEELRSVNEELVTVNAQLREKIEELQEANADIANLLSSTKLPALFLDRDFRIRRFTPEARTLLNVTETDIGRPIQHLGGTHIDDGMLEDAKRVLDGLAPSEKEIRSQDGEWYLRRILPYRTNEDRIGGVVVTFSQVTRLKRLTEADARAERQQDALLAIGLRALTEPDFRRLAEYATTSAAEVLACSLVKVLELEAAGERLRLVAGVGWERGAVGSATVPAGLESQGGYTIHRDEPVVVLDIREERRFAPPDLLKRHGVISGVSTVIRTSRGVYGAIGVHCRKPREFDRGEVDFLQQVAGILSITLERTRAEGETREMAERLVLARDASGLGIHEWDPRTGKFLWDDRLRTLWGVGPEETITYDLFMSGVHPEDRARTQDLVDRALDPSGDGHYSAEYRVINRASGETRWIWATGRVVFESGEPARLIGAVQDITKMKRDEQTLRDSEERLRLAAEAGEFGTYDVDFEGGTVLWSDRLYRLLGREPAAGGASIRPAELPEEVHPEDRETLREEVERSLDPDGPGTIDTTHRILIGGDPGEVRYLRVLGDTIFGVRAGRSVPRRAVGIITDVTDERLHERRMQSIMQELNHRVKNTLAVVEAIASQTARRATDLDSFRRSFRERLRAMSQAHSILTRSNWEGSTIGSIIEAEVGQRVADPSRLEIDGADLRLKPQAALGLHMAIHELATNAQKYGGLSGDQGLVRIGWSFVNGDIVLRWEERAPAPPPEPSADGFGTTMIRNLVEYELGGTLDRRFREGGLSAVIEIPGRWRV